MPPPSSWASWAAACRCGEGSVSRPVIGICAAQAQARWSHWDQQAVLLPRSYIDAVQRAGGLAVMIPPDETLERDPDEVLDVLDGLVLAGGADIDPASYGEPAHPGTQGTRPGRGASGIALGRRAVGSEIPL